jgi:hypothetical protein
MEWFAAMLLLLLLLQSLITIRAGNYKNFEGLINKVQN